MKKFIPVIVLIVLGIALIFSMFNKTDENIQSHLHGNLVAEFELPSLYENQPQLTDKILKQQGWKILNIFASWCEPCPEEHPHLAELAKIIPVYGIAFKDKPNDTKDYLNKYGNIYTAIGVDETGGTGITLGISAVPETYVIDGDGVIRFKYKGAITPQVVKKHILPLIKK